MGAEPIVYVVDDDKLSRMSICALVKSMGVGAQPFASAEEFLSAYEHDWPGCLVTDVRMLGMSGLELQEQLAERGVDLPVILITAYANTPLTVRAIQNGAVTLLEKPYNDQDLWDAVCQALAQDSETRQKRSEKDQILQRLESLTDDEHQVLDRIMQGKANKVIASELEVSVRTVESRRHNIFKKTGTESVAELVRLVMTVDLEK